MREGLSVAGLEAYGLRVAYLYRPCEEGYEVASWEYPDQWYLWNTEEAQALILSTYEVDAETGKTWETCSTLNLAL